MGHAIPFVLLMKNFNLQPFYPEQTPRYLKMKSPQRKIKKLSHAPFYNFHHSIIIMLYVKYGIPPKLGLKAMKPTLESSFCVKIKNENNRLIDMIGMIEPLSSTLPSASNSSSCFKKS